ncbi:hypothetical protein JCM10213_004279 [Rhodosporidiobolus nylandii]
MSRYAPARGPPRLPKVDREKTCPSLLRVFVKTGVHHQDSEFSTTHLPTQDEHQLYTWRDTTLREILLLLRDASPPLRTSPLARYSLRLVFWDADSARFQSSDLAVIAAKDLLATGPNAPGARAGPGVYTNPRLDRTLAEAKFVVGDYLDVAFLGVAPPPVEAGPGGPLPPLAAGPGPQFAPRGAPPHLAGPAGRGGFGGGPRGGGAPHVGRRDDTTWAPVQRGGGGGGGPPGPRGAPYPPRGGGGGGFGGRPGPADMGWNRRRSSTQDDRPPPPRRRDSRSLSPDRHRRRSPSRSRSPPPGRRDSRADAMDMRE